MAGRPGTTSARTTEETWRSDTHLGYIARVVQPERPRWQQQSHTRFPACTAHTARAAIKQEVGGVEGVEGVEVDLDAKKVTVSGSALDDARVRPAIDEAGYDVAS
jgi:copper chaperone CopZ